MTLPLTTGEFSNGSFGEITSGAYTCVLDGDARLAQICAKAGVHFAQKREIVLGGARYLCCTLWTDFAVGGSVKAGMYNAGKMMNDYQYIRMESERYRHITPLDVVRVHTDHRAWLSLSTDARSW